MIIPILIAVIVGAALILFLMFLRSNNSSEKSSNTVKTIQKKGKSAIVKELEKKLSHDSHNIPALKALGAIYFDEGNWEKTFTIYKNLYDLSVAHTEISVAKTTQRMGIAAFNLGKIDDCLNSLMISMQKDSGEFDTNYYCGKAFYAKGTYDKALICFKKAKLIHPEATDLNEQVGLCLYKLQKYKESLTYLKSAIDEKPGNKELLFYLAVAMSECSLYDKALKLFIHLRPDPEFGVQACLEAGKLHERLKNYSEAIQDYEIGMKLQNVPEQISLQIKYKCANCLIATNDINGGLNLLKRIQAVHAGYKDVDSLVARYQDLTKNKNLQIYMLAGTSDFVVLCRKFISSYYKDTFVKIEDVSVASENVEIICSVEGKRWESKEMFRFYRNSTVIGDIYVRDFHSKMRDLKCDSGLCVTMGSFSESAHKYTEGRPIDLLEKDELCSILNKINIV